MGARCCCSHHLHAELCRKLCRFYIEIVQNFQMIRNKPERRNQHVLHAFVVESAKMIQDVRTEPRLVRRPAPALKCQIPTLDPGCFRCPLRRFPKLLLVFAVLGH